MIESFESYEKVKEISECLLLKIKYKPKLGLICGTGLGNISDQVTEKQVIAYDSIPGFPKIKVVEGHSGCFVFGMLKGVPTICMQGRIHPYQGVSSTKCALPIRIMKLMEVEVLIVTNAAGAINPDYNVGDFMIIKDHISWPTIASGSPLRGCNDERWGPMFVSLHKAYSPKLIGIAKKVSKELRLENILREGVYCQVCGPCYETAAEVKALKILGADATGMSTSYEVIVARQCGIHVLGISLVTNKCICDWDSNEEPNHEEVIMIASKRSKELEALICKVVEELKFESNVQSIQSNGHSNQPNSYSLQTNGLSLQSGRQVVKANRHF